MNFCIKYKCWNMIGLIFQEELILTKQMHQKSVIIVCYYWYFSDKNFKYELYLFYGYHNLMQKAMNFNDVATASVKESDYRIHFCYMSKNDATNIMKMFNQMDRYNFFLLYIKN